MILTKATNFKVWEKIVKNELKGQGFKYLIDPTKPGPTKCTEVERDKQKSQVYSYIMCRLDEGYQRQVSTVEEPEKILLKLWALHQPKMPSLCFATRRNWSLMIMGKKETADEFIQRYDEATKKVALFESTDERDVTENFLIAIEN